MPEGAQPHVGTTDVDLVIGVALGDDTPETYRTLHQNLRSSGFTQAEPSFAWRRNVDGMTVKVEFLCETDKVAPGAIFRPREGTGAKLAAFNVRGAMLARDDFIEVSLEGERLDGGGRSRVTLRVANVLPYVVLKVFAFQDRHENKEAYDLIFVLFNAEGGPRACGQRAATSPVAGRNQTSEALALLAERFGDVTHDGPSAYGNFPNEQAALKCLYLVVRSLDPTGEGRQRLPATEAASIGPRKAWAARPKCLRDDVALVGATPGAVVVPDPLVSRRGPGARVEVLRPHQSGDC